MSEIIARNPLPMLGAAALLKSCHLSFVDGNGFLRIYATANGSRMRMPKDDYSDSLRFAEALEEKIPTDDFGRPLAGVFPTPLGYEGDVPADESLTFERAWRRRSYDFTFVRWGHCYQTMAWQHMQGGVFQELDISANREHYYNILLFPHEKEEFVLVNPNFEIEMCNQRCVTASKGGKSMHFHAVHGFYKGSVVAGIDCAPPFRLSPHWVNQYRFDMDILKKTLGMPPPEEIATIPKGVPVAIEDVSLAGPGDGAMTLAGFCGGRSHFAEWELLKVTYRTPTSALWASTAAYSASHSGQRKIRNEWNKEFQELVLPKLWGKGSPLPVVLQRVWETDKGASKIKANYFMRRLFGLGGIAYKDPKQNIRSAAKNF
jgi:hypothetical protein